MDTAETAIAHDQDMVPRLRSLHYRNNQFFHVIKSAGFMLDGGKCLLRIPAEIGAIAEYAISLSQAVGQGCLHHAQLHGIRTRLQYCQNTRITDAGPQPRNRCRNCGRVVGEVIINSDTVDHATRLHTAFYILELPQRLDADLSRHPGMSGSGNGGQCIHAVMLAKQIPAYPSL